MAPSPPRSVGRYVVYRELASGGMAAVYFARLLGPSGFGRTVAVKRPHAHLATDRAFIMMLMDEARLASRVHHPNVVTTLDVIETPTELALAMDYVHGESLSRLITAARHRGERVPVPIAAAIVIDALRGLHAAHEATDERGAPLGIVHRDISPQNLLVGADGISRIADFGIAKAAGRLLTTRDGSIKGKYAYMSPEQIRGEKVDRTTDVYAAAIILWELLTGEGLFRGATEGEVIYKCLEAKVEAPSKRDPSVAPALDAIALRALARDPAERYPTARDMADDLERAVPAIRPSEIGAWVQRLVGETLAARAAIIAEMEAADVSSSSERPSAMLVLAPPVEVEVATTTEPSGRVLEASAAHSQVSHPGVVAGIRPGAAPPRALQLFAVAAFSAALLIGGYAVLSFGRHDPARAATSAEAAPPAPSVSATAVASAPAIAASAAPAEPPSSTAPSSSARPAAAAAPSLSARPVVRAPRRGTKSIPGCDPPYTIDGMGREVFKLQCL